MLRIALISLLSFTLPSAALAYSNQQTWLDTRFVESAFVNVALRNEYSAGKKPLVKWNKPVRIWVDHRVADSELHDELTNAHIRHLAAITGHSITRVSSREQANIIWIFTQESQWRKDIEGELGKPALDNVYGAICKAGYRLNPDSSMSGAAVIIPVDQAREHGKLLACIVEEITQVMGLPNDSESAYPSIFNDQTPEDLLSPLDVILLRLLYEPELKAGMSEQEAKPVVANILRRYKKNGTLERAVSVAKSGELFQLIGY